MKQSGKKSLICILLGLVLCVASAFALTACKKSETVQSDNEITSLTLAGWAYGETPNTPHATAKHGTVEFTYATEEDGTYTATVPTAVGTYYVKASVAETKEYKAAERVISFTISKADNAISNFTITGWTYGEAANAPQATAKDGTVEFTYATEENGTYTATVPTDAGTYYVKASTAASDNYNAAEAKKSFVISKADNAISNFTITGWTYGEAANAPQATAKDGTVEFTYADEENGTYTATVPANAGTYYVKASVAATANYNAVEAKKSFVISKAADVVGKPNVPADAITCCVGLPTSYGEISVRSGSAVTFRYSKNGTDFTDSIAANEVVAGKYYVKAYSAGNDNYLGGESEATELTVVHKHEIKKVDGEYKNVCACGDEIALPEVKAAFTVDGVKVYEVTVEYGSTLTAEIVNNAKTEIEKTTDRKVISVDYDAAEELLEDSVITMTMDYGYMVEGGALKMSYVSNGGNPYATLDTSVTAPEGFTRVLKTTKTATTNMAYSQLTLSNYKTIFFALKTSGTFKLDSNTTTVTDGSWMIFTVTRNADGKTWDIVVKNEAGTVLQSEQGLNADEKAVPYYKDSLASLLWGSRGTGYCWSLTEGQTMWSTEIRADRTDAQRAASFGTEVGKLFDEDKLALEDITTSADLTVKASGFEKVYKSTAAVTSYNDRALSDVDYTNYSEIRFAVMTSWLIRANGFNNGSDTGAQVGNMNWYYYTLVQTAANTWKVTISDEGGRVLATKDNINGVKANYVTNSVDEILWGVGDLFRIVNASTAQQNAGNLVVYCTELRGTLAEA